MGDRKSTFGIFGDFKVAKIANYGLCLVILAPKGAKWVNKGWFFWSFLVTLVTKNDQFSAFASRIWHGVNSRRAGVAGPKMFKIFLKNLDKFQNLNFFWKFGLLITKNFQKLKIFKF